MMNYWKIWAIVVALVGSHEALCKSTMPNPMVQIDEAIRAVLADSIKPDGLVNGLRLIDLTNVFDNDYRLMRIGAGAGAVRERIAKIIEQAPRASQIVRNGYDIDRYKKDLELLEQQKSRYAQPLLDRMVSDWKAALSVLNGYPEGTISSPSPYDDPYEALVSQYMGFVRRLEALGENPALSDLIKLNQDFATQFDRILRINDIGKDRKKVLIDWLGGEKNYLGPILGALIVSRSPGFPSSGIVPMS